MRKPLLRPIESHFYKYASCNLDWLKPIVTRNELYFPTPIQLNDPAEAKPRLTNLTVERICSFLYDMHVINNPSLSSEDYQEVKAQIEHGCEQFGSLVLQKEITRILHTELETIRIYSMSKRPDNMSLWAKYADVHKGYCLEFSNSGFFASAREVSYGDVVDFDPTDIEQRKANLLFQKALDWKTEEVRLITPRGSESIVLFDPNLLTRIIVGQHMPDAEISVIQEWANLRSPTLSMVRAEYDVFEHKLNFIPFS
jgi:hypothetical protein